MTQPNDGGVKDSDVQNGGNNTDGQTNEFQAQLDEMKTQLEALKKESAGKDRTISKYQKEIEAASLANKTADEQLAYYKEQASIYERKETFRQAFKEIGLNPDEFIEIVDEKEPKAQAEKFANLLKTRSDESVKKALESFKQEELKKKGSVPQNTDVQLKKEKYADANAAIRAALGR